MDYYVFLSLTGMNTTYVLLGGNLGDRLQNLELAVSLMEQRVGATAKKSAIYVTKAWGKEEQPDFYNQVVCLKTELKPQELLNTLLRIEEEMGRVRHEKWAERMIDLDILFYNSDIIDTETLQVPHPHLQDRRFVLVPLCEIAEELTHPVYHKTAKQLLNECKDPLEVKQLTIDNRP